MKVMPLIFAHARVGEKGVEISHACSVHVLEICELTKSNRAQGRHRHFLNVDHPGRLQDIGTEIVRKPFKSEGTYWPRLRRVRRQRRLDPTQYKRILRFEFFVGHTPGSRT